MHDSQKRWRLELAERAGAAAFEETWTAQTGYHKNGADSHEFPGRNT